MIKHTAKRSIAYYIELLRTNNEETISYEVLHEKMSFAALFQLFTEEILYRYWEHETSEGMWNVILTRCIMTTMK